ncbi:MAG: HPP family protein [Sideroxydans sp.]|jgi:CBS-domain-containing membrane protein
MNFHDYCKSFKPHPLRAAFGEKLRSGVVGGLAIFLLAWALHFLPQSQYPLLLLGSMAASAVLLYAVPHSPLAQPWNLVGGHLFSAICGWLSMVYIGDPLLAAGVAVGAAIFLMYVLNCLHPPGAATALTLVLGASHFQQMGLLWTALIVVANAGIMLLLALLLNNALPRRHYPQMLTTHTHTAPPSTQVIIIPEQEDLEWVLEHEDSPLDISIEDLTEVYWLAQQRAQARYNSVAR